MNASRIGLSCVFHGPSAASDSRFPKAVRFRGDTSGDGSSKKTRAEAAAPTVICTPPQRRKGPTARSRSCSTMSTLMRTSRYRWLVATEAATLVRPTWTPGQAASSSSTATSTVGVIAAAAASNYNRGFSGGNTEQQVPAQVCNAATVTSMLPLIRHCLHELSAEAYREH